MNLVKNKFIWYFNPQKKKHQPTVFNDIKIIQYIYNILKLLHY